jgi:hypothetical protein
MAKKLLFTIFFSVFMILSFFTVSYAESSNTTTTLGNEVTTSMNKTERSMNDLVDRTEMDNVGNAVENGARSVGNTVNNGMNAIENGVNNLMNNDDNNNNTRTDNRTIAGTTGNYTAGQQLQGTTNNGMSGNTWIWIVMIVVALIIVAVVWYYAAAQNQ